MKFINQKPSLKRITAAINMTKSKNRHYNFLIISPAGMGKTTLAKLYFETLKVTPYESLGSTYNPVQHSLQNSPYIFVDEVHDLENFETLYPFMDSVTNTTFFCTTEFSKLPEAFTSRCIILRFGQYELKDLTEIIVDYSRYLGFQIENDTAELIAKRCKKNPRVGKLMLMEAAGMFKTFKYEFSMAGFEKLFNELGIYDNGLTLTDISYLTFVHKLGNAGLKTISRGIRVDETTVLENIEPWLIQNDYIQITNRGRIINENTYQLLPQLRGEN